MKIHSANMTAGIASHIPLPGRYFRILSAAGIIEVEFSNGVRTDFVAGLGAALPEFKNLVIVSPVDQVVLMAVSDLPIDDNRLSDAGAASNEYGAVSVGTAATLVRAANPSRREILIQNNGLTDIYVGSSAAVTTANGVRVMAEGGTFSTQAVGAVYAISGNPGQDVRFSEDVN